jgi:hypothetical protein
VLWHAGEMNGPQLQLWPAQERVLSPVALVVIGAPTALVGGALLSGDLRLLALAIAALAAAIGDKRFFTVEWVARLDERFATSTFVKRRLRRRARRRDLIRCLLPAAKAVARWAGILVAGVASVAIAAGLAGFVPPASAAGYHGHIDVGLSATNIEGSYSYAHITRQRFAIFDGLEPFSAAWYSRTERIAAAELADPATVARRVLRHLFEATSRREDFDPFA